MCLTSMPSETLIPFFVKEKKNLSTAYLHIIYSYVHFTVKISSIYIYFVLKLFPWCVSWWKAGTTYSMLESIALNQVVWVPATPTPPGATATHWPWMTILSIVNSWKKVYPPQRIAVRVKWVHRYKLFWGYLLNAPPCTPEESGAYSKSSLKVTGKLEPQPEPRQLPGKERRESVLSAVRSSVSVTCSDSPPLLPPPISLSFSVSPTLISFSLLELTPVFLS